MSSKQMEIMIEENNKWICDSCGGIIERPEEGYIEWLTNPHRGFKIVHHKAPNWTRCLYPSSDGASNRSLVDCFLKDGFMDILELLSRHNFSKLEGIEILKRIYVFGYDRCKDHFASAIRQGLFEPNMSDGFYTDSQIREVLEWIEGDR